MQLLIKKKGSPPQTKVTVADSGSPVESILFLASKFVLMIWLSNLLALSVPDEGYYRNESWALNLISTILFTLSHFKGIAGFHVLLCWKFAFYDINFAFHLVLLKFWCRVNFLFQPFWPQGTGCARGFLGAMDSAWMIKKWKEMQGRPFDIIAERESIYKVLSQTNPNNLKKKYSEYTVDPKSR